MDKKYYTIKEASKMLNLTEQVVRNYIYLERLKATKILNSTAISKEEIERYINKTKKMQ